LLSHGAPLVSLQYGTDTAKENGNWCLCRPAIVDRPIVRRMTAAPGAFSGKGASGFPSENAMNARCERTFGFW